MHIVNEDVLLRNSSGSNKNGGYKQLVVDIMG